MKGRNMLHSVVEYRFIVVKDEAQFLLILPSGCRIYVDSVFNATKFLSKGEAEYNIHDSGAEKVIEVEFRALNLSYGALF